MRLQVEHIRKSFDGVSLLENITFSLETGTITSLFGENGSGKTTLFNIISGLIKPDLGKILLDENEITGQGAVRIARLGIGRLWQKPRVFHNLTVFDNLTIPAKDHPGESLRNYFFRPRSIIAKERELKERAVTISRAVKIYEKLQKTAGLLSLGEQKLLSTGMLLMSEAKVFLLDEPFAGVNAQMIENLSEVLLDLKTQGKIILFIEHNRSKAMEISDRTIWLEKGNNVELQ